MVEELDRCIRWAYHASRCTAASCSLRSCGAGKRLWEHLHSSKCQHPACNVPGCVACWSVIHHCTRCDQACCDQACETCLLRQRSRVMFARAVAAARPRGHPKVFAKIAKIAKRQEQQQQQHNMEADAEAKPPGEI